MSKYKITYDFKVNLTQEQCFKATLLEGNGCGTLDGIIKRIINAYLDKAIEDDFLDMVGDINIKEEKELEKNKAKK